MTKHKIIIDTDIGTYYDDAFAVLLATRSPDLDLVGVTTFLGDTHLRARIARKVLDVAGGPNVRSLRVLRNRSRARRLCSVSREKRFSLGAIKGSESSDEHAVNFIIRTIMANPGEVTVVTLGAVTNIAMAYLMEPAIAQNMKELIMMAAVVVPIVDQKGVRRSPIEEYNFNNDPMAAQIVINRSDMPKTFVRSTLHLRSRCALIKFLASINQRIRWRAL